MILIVSFLCLEVLMTVTDPYLFKDRFEYDPDLGFRTRAYFRSAPGIMGEGDDGTITNRFGFNDRDYPLTKEPGTFRILVVGDSFGWAGGLKANYTALLEQMFEKRDGSHRVDIVNTGYPAKYSPAQLLSQPARLSRVDLYTAAATPFVGEVTLVASRAGSLHGIGGWFSSQLSPSVSLTNSPIDRQPMERRNVFLPIDQCIPLAEGDVVRVRLHIDPREMMLSWNVEVTGKIKRSFTHSTLNGMLLSQEDLEKTLPEFVPRLNPHGEARRSVLELCDGKRSLKEIEQEVFRRHSSLFASGAEAAAFIAEVVTGYSL